MNNTNNDYTSDPSSNKSASDERSLEDDVKEDTPLSPATQMKLRRAANLKRNQERLVSLGLTNTSYITSTSNNKHRIKSSKNKSVKKHTVNNNSGCGMKMFRRKWDKIGMSPHTSESLEDVVRQWPHRTKQIQMIARLLEPCVKACYYFNRRQRNLSEVARNADGVIVTSVAYAYGIPVCRPMLVTGPTGTGKTGVVKDVVGWLKSKYTSAVGVAYVDASIAFSSGKDIYGSILQQLVESFSANVETKANELKGSRTALKHKQSNSCSPNVFGKKLAFLLRDNRSAILVLDNAEQCVSFQTNRQRILTQFMLLPSDMNLRLNLIAISSKPLVGKSHISLSQEVVGTLEDLVVPIRINFTAYEANNSSMFRDILMLPKIKKTIIRIKRLHCATSIIDRVYETMIECLLRSLLSSTRELPEIVRLAKLLWPKYVEPIESIPLDGSTITPSFTQIDIKARSYVEVLLKQCMLDNSTILSSRVTKKNDLSLSSMPQATKFLILAAVLSQHNSEHHDQNLYTNQTKTKNRRKKKLQGENKEDDNFGGKVGISKLVRPFNQERMFSTFVSIYDQYGEASDSMNSGSLSFYRNVAELQRLGILLNVPCEFQKRFKCSISEVMAERIALDVNFPLSRYLR